jgi:hypothetical protein
LTLRLEPTEDLHNLYKLVGRQYSKKKGNKTINCLDLNHLRNDVGQKINQVRELFEHIEKFGE